MDETLFVVTSLVLNSNKAIASGDVHFLGGRLKSRITSLEATELVLLLVFIAVAIDFEVCFGFIFRLPFFVKRVRLFLF